MFPSLEFCYAITVKAAKAEKKKQAWNQSLILFSFMPHFLWHKCMKV